MKKLTLALGLIFQSVLGFSQASGNINYQSKVQLESNNINISPNSYSGILLGIKGLANVKADSYLAIFNVTQVGKTEEEANDFLNKRIKAALLPFANQKNIETYVDMVTFVPTYEFTETKKIFSKRTYNEVPTGFEIKKNIHIKFTNINQLNDFITALAKEEIYDLVRVDYFSSQIENVKKELATKARTMLSEKMKNFEVLLGETFVSANKGIADGYKVMLPLEMYKDYEAYNSENLSNRRPGNILSLNKSKTLYYQPILDKEFDFTINPVIVEPVIQIMYEIKILINKDKKDSKKEYYIVTPNGELKTLPISNN